MTSSACRQGVLRIVCAAALALAITACGDDSPPGPVPGCSAATCFTGCCGADGTCQSTNPASSCGVFGGLCSTWKQCTATQSCDPVGRTCVDNTASCGPSNCNGCCQGNTCVDPVSISACGAGGGRCVACGATESCTNGACAVDCGPATCTTGCCEKNVCFTGDNPGICGTGGAACKACGNGEACLSKKCTTQACDSTSCPLGCCDASGNCVGGDTEATCGKAGVACKECSPGDICDKDRVCKTPTVNCDASICADGCCDTSGNCVKTANQTGVACGAGGGACNTCAASQECASGKCTCTTKSCTSGCCEGDSCRSGSTNTACGTAGAKCDVCTGSESCQSGTCKSTYDCAKQCAGCCDNNTCITNGPTNDAQCGKGGKACIKCIAGKTCQSGLCLGTGLCAACGVGTCCSTTGCTSGTTNTECGDNGDPCDDCTTGSIPKVCDSKTRKCVIDPNSLWKVIVDSVKLKTDYWFDNSPSDPKPWDPPDPFVEVWHSVSTFSVKGSTKTIDDKYVATFNEVVLSKVKASKLLPSSTGAANFAIRVWDDDTWPNPNDEIAYCKKILLSTADFSGSVRAMLDCTVTGSVWPTFQIIEVTFRLLPDP